jgi:hypothetical protein
MSLKAEPISEIAIRTTSQHQKNLSVDNHPAAPTSRYPSLNQPSSLNEISTTREVLAVTG